MIYESNETHFNKKDGKDMNTSLAFDPAAYRRIRLPRLLLLLFLSLIMDGIVICFWQTGVSPNAKFYWDIGFAFLCIVNLLFVKGVALHQYLHIKKLRARSYVRLEKDKVIHYLLRSRMSHWQVEGAKETKFPADGKEEYISAYTFYIRHVKNLSRRPNGSILIEGTIDSESFNEGWEEYSSEYGKVFKKTIKRHTIPAYYEGMDMIFQTLHMLK
jgi:hypothetical protein